MLTVSLAQVHQAAPVERDDLVRCREQAMALATQVCDLVDTHGLARAAEVLCDATDALDGLSQGPLATVWDRTLAEWIGWPVLQRLAAAVPATTTVAGPTPGRHALRRWDVQRTADLCQVLVAELPHLPTQGWADVQGWPRAVLRATAARRADVPAEAARSWYARETEATVTAELLRHLALGPSDVARALEELLGALDDRPAQADVLVTQLLLGGRRQEVRVLAGIDALLQRPDLSAEHLEQVAPALPGSRYRWLRAHPAWSSMATRVLRRVLEHPPEVPLFGDALTRSGHLATLLLADAGQPTAAQLQALARLAADPAHAPQLRKPTLEHRLHLWLAERGEGVADALRADPGGHARLLAAGLRSVRLALLAAAGRQGTQPGLAGRPPRLPDSGPAHR